MNAPATLTCPSAPLPREAHAPVNQPAGRRTAAPALISAMLALLVTGLMVTIGVSVLNRYHASAPYRHDSAGYRACNVLVYDQYLKDGRWATARYWLSLHDTFDVLVRLTV